MKLRIQLDKHDLENIVATPYARRITGQTIYVDGGVNIMA